MRDFLQRFKRLLFGDGHEKKIGKLRKQFPDCVINTTHIYDSHIGEKCVVHADASLVRSKVGSFSYVAHRSVLRNVIVGKFCSIGPDVEIGLNSHPSSTFVSTYPGFYSDMNESCPISFINEKIYDDSIKETVLGNDVWIGAKVLIAGGITVGTGAIIAAGSVVVKDVPPFGIIGGNPAKLIRYRFSDEEIRILTDSQWWQWDSQFLKEHVYKFRNVEYFTKWRSEN